MRHFVSAEVLAVRGKPVPAALLLPVAAIVPIILLRYGEKTRALPAASETARK
jgi:hypothetical protein